MLMYTAPQRRAGVGASFRVHKNGSVPGPRPDLRSGTLVDGERARVGRAQPLAELQQIPPQQGRREHVSSLSIEGFQQHIQSSTQAFGANHMC